MIQCRDCVPPSKKRISNVPTPTLAFVNHLEEEGCGKKVVRAKMGDHCVLLAHARVKTEKFVERPTDKYNDTHGGKAVHGQNLLNQTKGTGSCLLM